MVFTIQKSPFDDCCRPGQACAEGDEEDQVALFNTALL